MASKRIKWRDRTPANDIKYGGFLSYRHVRIIGWVFMIVAQLSVVFEFNVRLNPASEAGLQPWISAFKTIASLPLPLFMLANFSVILQGREGFKRLIIFYGSLALGLYALANLLVLHFGYTAMHAFVPETTIGDATRAFGAFMPLLGPSAYSLNLFIDLFLCVLLFYFANFTPEHVFTGKKIIIFRSLIILPIAYEIAGFFIKYFISLSSAGGGFDVPSPVFFLLPSKPPAVFLAFVIIVFCLKISERLYLRREGNTQETYKEYLTTKAHSLRVSILIAIVFVAAAVVDLIGSAVAVTVVTVNTATALDPSATKEEIELILSIKVEALVNAGVGGAISMFAVAPIAMLFSYTKKHKNPKIDLFVPIAGISLIAIVYLEGMFQVVVQNVELFVLKLRDILNQITAEDGGAEGGGNAPSLQTSSALLEAAKSLLHSLPFLHK